MRGYTARQLQEPTQPAFLVVTEFFNVDPGVGTGDDGADANHNDVDELMGSATFYAWVCYG
jgi:hypothetical protein